MSEDGENGWQEGLLHLEGCACRDKGLGERLLGASKSRASSHGGSPFCVLWNSITEPASQVLPLVATPRHWPLLVLSGKMVAGLPWVWLVPCKLVPVQFGWDTRQHVDSKEYSNKGEREECGGHDQSTLHGLHCFNDRKQYMQEKHYPKFVWPLENWTIITRHLGVSMGNQARCIVLNTREKKVAS